VKMSRRFIPLRDWTTELRELALASQYPTYSSFCTSYGFGFRSECVGMAVHEWIANRAHEQLAALAMAPQVPFVEGALHEVAKRVADFRCRRAMQWDEIHGLRPDDRAGYAPWEFMGTDRHERYPQFLWHDWARADDYSQQAQQWDLPYTMEDFIDPNQGFGGMPE
jgi:hypothetical protein